MNHTEEEFAATCASLRDALNLILIEGFRQRIETALASGKTGGKR